MKNLHHTVLLCFLLSCLSLMQAYDDVHRFRPIYFFEEPHLPREGLSNVYLSCAHGKARHGFAADHSKIPLFDIFGTHNIHDAARSVDPSLLNNPYGTILKDLLAYSPNPTYAHLSFKGKFELNEIVLKGFQNFFYGIFCAWYIPWRSISIITKNHCDLTSTAAATDIWRKFLNNQESILSHFNLPTAPYTRYGIGDIACSFGYAYSHSNTQWLDFIDASAEIGLAFPTSKVIKPCHFFDIPLGYNGHLGYFVIFDASLGWYDWITAGAHIQCLGFAPTQNIQRIKTDTKQKGLCILQEACMRIDSGGAYTGGLYLKADHVLLGFSCTLGYSIVMKTADRWHNIARNQPYTVSDERLASWSMQTIHIQLDYDCATHTNPNAPRVGFLYNTAFRGSRALATSVTGGLWEMTIIWSF